MRLYFSVLMLFVLTLATLVTGCHRGGPSDAEVSALVMPIAGQVVGGSGTTLKDAVQCSGEEQTISKVEVALRGEKNEQDGYWPVQVSIAGTCREFMNCVGRTSCVPGIVPFKTNPVSFKFHKNDFGKWAAEPSEN